MPALAAERDLSPCWAVKLACCLGGTFTTSVATHVWRVLVDPGVSLAEATARGTKLRLFKQMTGHGGDCIATKRGHEKETSGLCFDFVFGWLCM